VIIRKTAENKKMPNVEEIANREDVAAIARRRALRRIERFDILVALVLLTLLIVGWVVDFAPVQRWPGGHLLTASQWPHSWSGGALR
jgi:hypothetical protein